MAIITNGAAGAPVATTVTLTGTQTLTNKTLTSPTITDATFSGQQTGLEIAFAQSIVFEGTTANNFETTLSAGEPTADRVLTLPDSTGTLATMTDVQAGPNGGVTETGTQTLTNKTLTSPVLGGTTTTASGNLVVGPAAYILEVRGGASTEGMIQLNCAVNSHGQKIRSQTHAEAASNTLLLPGGTTIGNSDAVLVSDTGTQTLSNKTLTAPKINLAFNAQTGTTYTLVAADSGKLVTSSNASAVVITIPPSIFVAGEQINVQSIGAGLTSFAAGAGVTITSTGASSVAPIIRVQYAAVTVICTASNVFTVIGDIS